jgi:hypothetical protein
MYPVSEAFHLFSVINSIIDPSEDVRSAVSAPKVTNHRSRAHCAG